MGEGAQPPMSEEKMQEKVHFNRLCLLYIDDDLKLFLQILQSMLLKVLFFVDDVFVELILLQL